MKGLVSIAYNAPWIIPRTVWSGHFISGRLEGRTGISRGIGMQEQAAQRWYKSGPPSATVAQICTTFGWPWYCALDHRIHTWVFPADPDCIPGPSRPLKQIHGLGTDSDSGGIMWIRGVVSAWSIVYDDLWGLLPTGVDLWLHRDCAQPPNPTKHN